MIETMCNTLDSLLEGADLRFRETVIATLVREGFELDEPFPYLQHPLEILEAIRGLEVGDAASSWISFHRALAAAGRLGVLVDLRLQKTYACPSMSRAASGMFSPRFQPRLDTA